MSITEKEVATIEAATRDQSKNVAWFNQRATRITASAMKIACATDSGNAAQNLIKCICYPDFSVEPQSGDVSMRVWHISIV